MNSGFLRLCFILFVLCSFPSFVFAQTTTSSTDLQALIKQLEEQVKVLQSQVLNFQCELGTTKKELTEVKTELNLTHSLVRGSSGDEVKTLQEFLKQFPDIYPEGLVTGYFGPLTEAAVKKFQERQQIETVGAVGPKTLSKINELITQGAGASGVIPSGLLTAPGIQAKLATTTVVATTTPPVVSTTTVPIVPTSTTSTLTSK